MTCKTTYDQEGKLIPAIAYLDNRQVLGALYFGEFNDICDVPSGININILFAAIHKANETQPVSWKRCGDAGNAIDAILHPPEEIEYFE